MADELGYNPAGTGTVGCSTRATLTGGKATGLVALPRQSSARTLSQCRKSLRNLPAALLSLLFKPRTKDFNNLVLISPPLARATLGTADPSRR